MADEGSVQVIQKQETQEVLGTNGKDLGPSPLSDIFDKIEAGHSEGLETSEVIAGLEKESNSSQSKKPAATDTQSGDQKPDKAKEQAKEEVSGDEEETDPRKALQKALEKKQEDKSKKEAKSKEELKDVTPDGEGDLPEEELQPQAHDKPKTVRRIKQLLSMVTKEREVVAKTQKERDEKAAKLAELEKKLSDVSSVSPETNDKIKKQLDELAMYRRRYELDSDPDVKLKFDDRIATAEQNILDVLKSRGASDGLINVIKEAGGWRQFAESNKTVSVPDGEGGTQVITEAEFAEMLLEKIPLGKRKQIEALMMEQVSTQRDRERFYKEEQAKANEFFKKRDEDAKKSQEEQQKQIEAATRELETWRKQVENSDFLKDKEVKDDASPEDKAKALEHNKYNKQLRGLLRKAIEAKDLPTMLGVIEDHVRYYDERRKHAETMDELKQVKAALAAKTEELNRFKGAGRTTPRSGSIASPSMEGKASREAPKSLEEAFAKMERGEILRGGGSIEE